MINEPVNVVANDFQQAWQTVVGYLISADWELNNIVVHIRDVNVIDREIHEKLKFFAIDQEILEPKHVAYTIFPHRLYKGKDANSLFTAYNRPKGFYSRVKTGWGTYFHRMTNYIGRNGIENQLENIINAIRDRVKISRAAYTIVIQYPGGETIRPLGGPCLNYLAVQVDPDQRDHRITLGLLAVYRNHDFLERAYGNYWGLCNLIRFLAREIEGKPGPLTCVSSHAYVSGKKASLKALLREL